jgi:hypothetical protein
LSFFLYGNPFDFYFSHIIITMIHVAVAFCDKKADDNADKDIEIADLKIDIDKLKSELADAKARHQNELAEAEARHQKKLANVKADHNTICEILIDRIVNLQQKFLNEYKNHQKELNDLKTELNNMRNQYRA